MKSYTHPHLTNTLLIHKDGSSYGKYWLYPRAILTLETSDTSKNWESFANLSNHSAIKRPVRRLSALQVVYNLSAKRVYTRPEVNQYHEQKNPNYWMSKNNLI